VEKALRRAKVIGECLLPLSMEFLEPRVLVQPHARRVVG
jgi:hypothetical protein